MREERENLGIKGGKGRVEIIELWVALGLCHDPSILRFFLTIKNL